MARKRSRQPASSLPQTAVEEAREITGDPLPLAEDDPEAGAEGNIRFVEPPPPGWGDDLPLSE